tara:strand:+ start:999 stop:2264 length:1266 start_codon:yes stop_codon:yes gene_type:complete
MNKIKKLSLYIILFLVTFIAVSLLALPLFFDLIFSILILFIFRKKFFSIIILNFFIAIMVFTIDLTSGKNEKYGYFFRAHEKYKTKKAKYQENVSDTIFVPYGDIYFMDSGLSKKRESIKVPRVQEFITDSYGIRNDKTKIEDAEIILVGDSFINATGITQKYMPANILSKISGKKVASLTYNGLNPTEYELIINKYINIIKKDAKIFVFYFEGNDFIKINKPKVNSSKYIYWRGYEIPKFSGKIRFAYEKLEKKKDLFLLQILSDKNYFLRNVRAKSHLMYLKFFSKLHNTGSGIKYFNIGNKVVGFYNTDYEINNEYVTYIFQNKKILERVDGFFFIPIKLRIYSDYIDSVKIDTNNPLKYLKNSYSQINKPVYDLTKVMKFSVSKYLSEGKYLYWRDDTHWNHYGIYESMNYINSIIK